VPPERRLPYDAVLFDLDGTLVDTAPDITDALNGALADHDRAPVEEAWVRNRIGHGTRALLRAAALGDATADSMLLRFQHHYAAHCGRRGRLYPGAAAALGALRNAGVKLALVSNKESAFADFVLKVHGLDSQFDLRVGGDSLDYKKPDGRVLRHCLAQLAAAPSRALFVGDSVTDVQAARNGGVEIWCVDYGYNHGDPISEAMPDRVIGSLEELLSLASPGYSAPLASASRPYFRSKPRNWS
jgi:phosphoglycolate phosphatase